MLALLLGAIAMAVVTAPASAELGSPAEWRGAGDGDVIEGQYIVVFEDSAGRVAREARQRERELGFSTERRFRHAVEGFSAELSPEQVSELRSDPDVDFVTEDRRVEIAGSAPLVSGETVPTGVHRILAATTAEAREASGAGVAVIDTGVQLNHKDLDAAHGTNCISGGPANDDNGHGTHVAGTIGARNNGAGVVGVAPGTEVHAVKVLDRHGSGTWSSVICGIDWVTNNHEGLGIGVANMSLGGLGSRVRSCASTTDALHKAICKSTDAGVSYVVAAGNSGWDFDHLLVPDVPAAYPEVLTVTAMSDSDGAPGGSGGAPTCRSGELDDAAASFSNYAATTQGAAHTIAAPGVCIESTWLKHGYRTISGTSMASPHVAGVVALCIETGGAAGPCAGEEPAAVIARMRGDAEAFNVADPGYGFLRDPLTSPLPGIYYGFLTATLPPLPPAPPLSSSPPPSGKPPKPRPPEEAPTSEPAPPIEAPPATESPPLAELRPPISISMPAISGTAFAGETLEVSTGVWEGLGSVTYAFQWHRCDATGVWRSCAGISGAKGPTYEPGAADVGRRLRATVSARNVAGRTSVISKRSKLIRPSNRFGFGKVKRNPRKGIARLMVKVPGPGRVIVKRSKRVRPWNRAATRAGVVAQPVRPFGKAQRRISPRRCARSGMNRLRTRVKARVIYRPAGGVARTQERTLRLIRRC